MPIVTPNVVVHPLVILSVVDHYTRMSVDCSKRVIGILLGQHRDKTVDITSSYAIPFEEDEKDSNIWFLDHNYHETISDLFRKVNAKERPIGWYHTGPGLKNNDLEINQLIQLFIKDPVLVVVDLDARGNTQPIDCYSAVREYHDDGSPSTFSFVRLLSVVEAEEAEEIGIENLLRDIKDLPDSNLSELMKLRMHSVEHLIHNIKRIENFLCNTELGNVSGKYEVLNTVQEMVVLLSHICHADIMRALNEFVNDQMFAMLQMVKIRAVLELHDLIENRIENAVEAN